MLQFPPRKEKLLGIIHQSTFTDKDIMIFQNKTLLLVKVANITLIMFEESRCKHLTHRMTDLHNVIA